MTLDLAARTFSHFGVATGRWRVAPGCYPVRVGDPSGRQPLAGVVGRDRARCPASG